MNLRTWIILGLSLLNGCTPNPSRSNDPFAALSASDVYLRKGVEYMEIGNYRVAQHDLQKAIDLDSHNSEAHNALAVLAEKLEQPSEATRHFERALALDSENHAARNNYARFLCASGRRQEAMQQFQRVIAAKLYAHPELALTNAGLCAESAGDRLQAEQFFRKTLALQADFPPALLALARLSQANRQALSARGFLQRYLDAAPASPEVLRLGVQIENSLGNDEAAEAYQRRLSEGFPGQGEVDNP